MAWLARTAEVAAVFADFPRLRAPRNAPVEVPVPREHPLNREWTLVCEGQDFTLCLTGCEQPESGQRADGLRCFEGHLERRARRGARGLADLLRDRRGQAPSRG